MRIAIHHRPGSFSDRWIEYCNREGIEYKIVNAYDSDIIEQLSDCDAFMWHHHQAIVADVLFARQLIYSIESKGIVCYPNFKTTWHFDDKVGQKYLLEAIGVPMVPSYVFYAKEEALLWTERTKFPKVFKLRGGASAVNVSLVHTAKKARKLIKRAFNGGFVQSNFKNLVIESLRKFNEGKITLVSALKSIVAYWLKPSDFRRMIAPEKGYVYFQEFMPNNSFDIRVCVVNNKAFAIKRLTRKDDFRASGSGNIIYRRSEIDERCVERALEANDRLKMQSVAYDFVFDQNNMPLIVEISYGFAMHAYDKCEGWWDHDMNWHPGTNFDFCGWMVETVIREVAK